MCAAVAALCLLPEQLSVSLCCAVCYALRVRMGRWLVLRLARKGLDGPCE